MDRALTGALSHIRRGTSSQVMEQTSQPDRRRKIRTTAFILGAMALLIYLGFIAIGMLRT